MKHMHVDVASLAALDQEVDVPFGIVTEGEVRTQPDLLQVDVVEQCRQAPRC